MKGEEQETYVVDSHVTIPLKYYEELKEVKRECEEKLAAYEEGLVQVVFGGVRVLPTTFLSKDETIKEIVELLRGEHTENLRSQKSSLRDEIRREVEESFTNRFNSLREREKDLQRKVARSSMRELRILRKRYRTQGMEDARND